MKVYFNSLGIITNTDTSTDSLRQGSANIKLEAIFEGIDNSFYTARFNFTRNDGSRISNVVMDWNDTNAEEFDFLFSDEWFFAKSGQTTLTIFLTNAEGQVIAEGQYQFNIEATDYDEEPTITINQYNEIMTAIAGKVATSNIIDNLESDASDKPLSARMGKVLKQDVDTSVASAKSEIYAKVEEETTRIETELDTKFETERAELRAQVAEIKEENEYLRGEVKDLRNGLYGSVLGLEDEAYDNVGVSQVDRANDYPVVSDQKALVKNIKGRTLNVNQLIKNYDFSTNTDWSFVGVEPVWGTNKITLSTTKTGSEWSIIYQNRPTGKEFVSGNKYFFSIKCSKSSNLKMRIRYPAIVNLEENEYIFVADQELQSLYIQFQSTDGAEASVEITQIKVTSLNKAFASQTLPTTIEEFNRLTMGFDFDTYNEGTLTSTEISKFMVNPFNAFDGELENKLIQTSGSIVDNDYYLATKNYIKVVCGAKYTVNSGYDSVNIYLAEYDKNQQFIRRLDPPSFNTQLVEFTLSNDTCFVKFCFGSISGKNKLSEPCFHLTGNGAFNGTYRPHIAPTEYPIPTVKLNGVGTAQDEKTETELKKVINSYTFTGNEPIQLTNWQPREGTYAVGFANSLLPNIKLLSDGAVLGNIRMADLGTATFNDTYNGIVGVSVYAGGGANYSIFIRVPTSIATDNATLLQWLVGKTVYYETKTPITLKKKTTGKVNGALLNWKYNSTHKLFLATISNAVKGVNGQFSNIFCSEYVTIPSMFLGVTGVGDKQMFIVASNNVLAVRNNSYTDPVAFGNSFTAPIYYETAQEVTETVDELFLPEIILEGVERGGTVATDSNGDITLTHVVYKPIQ